MFERLWAKLGFYTELAASSVLFTAFHLGRRVQGKTPPVETLRELADEINFSDLFVPAKAQDLVRQSSYSMGRNGQLFLEGFTLDSYTTANQGVKLLFDMMEHKPRRLEISQKMARRIAKAAQREGCDVPPYVQYRATRADGRMAEYTQTAAMYSAIGLSWFVVGSAGLAHVFEIFQVQPITESCKPAVRAQATQSLCYEWNKKEQAVSVWKKKTRDEINKNLPFYAPPFSYEKIQNIPYSDVPKYPEAIDSLTAYAGKAGCPSASSQKLRQAFEGISQLPFTPDVKQAATVRVVEQIVQTPKNACSML